jgi:hypothetical protein
MIPRRIPCILELVSERCDYGAASNECSGSDCELQLLTALDKATQTDTDGHKRKELVRKSNQYHPGAVAPA